MYPFKYPNLYGELAMQGKTKKELAKSLNITLAGLRYKQSLKTDGDFRGEEMRVADFLCTVDCDSTEESVFAFAHEQACFKFGRIGNSNEITH